MALLDNLFCKMSRLAWQVGLPSAATAKHGVHSVEKSVVSISVTKTLIVFVEKNVDIAGRPANSGVANSFVFFKLTML